MSLSFENMSLDILELISSIDDDEDKVRRLCEVRQ